MRVAKMRLRVGQRQQLGLAVVAQQRIVDRDRDAPPTVTPLRPLPRHVTFDSDTSRALLNRLMPST